MSQPTTWGTPRAEDGATDPADYAERADDSFDALLSGHRGTSRPAYAVAGTVWVDSDTDQMYMYDGVADFQIAVNVGAPASASAAGVQGDVAWDANYFYICTAANTWKRVAVSTW